MKKSKTAFYILIGFLFTITHFIHAQSTYFTFGNSRMDRGKLIHVNNSNSIFIAGETEDATTGTKLLFLTSVTADGKVNWYKTYGGEVSYAVNDWVITKDKEFILSAEQYYLNDRETLYLTKMDSIGNLLWSKLFDEGGNEIEVLSIAQTKDGGNIVTGMIKIATMAADIFYPIKQESQYVYVLKTDKNGNKEWSKKINYEAGSPAIGNKVLETEGGFLVGGSMGDTTKQSSGMFLMKLDVKGNFLWAKSYRGNKNDFVKNILLADNDIFIIGPTTSFGDGKTDGYVARLNNKGDLKWFKTYGGSENENFKSIVKTNENTLLISGETESYGQGLRDGLIMNINLNGEVLSSESFGQNNLEEIGSATTTNNQLFATGFSFASSVPKSSQAFLLSYSLNNQNKKCFFQSADLSAKDHTGGINVKVLNKEMLSDVSPLPGKKEGPEYKTNVKSQAMTTETFCK